MLPNLTNELEWAIDLKKQLTIILNDLKSTFKYSFSLPDKVEIIPDQYRNLENYGHPISWLIFGTTGIQAFAIGLMNNCEPNDNRSEKHLIPPTLNMALASLGPEYAYSQVAIIVVPTNFIKSSTQEEWIKIWEEENSYMRKICIYENSEKDTSNLAKYIIQHILSPWKTVISTSFLSDILISIQINDED